MNMKKYVLVQTIFFSLALFSADDGVDQGGPGRMPSTLKSYESCLFKKMQQPIGEAKKRPTKDHFDFAKRLFEELFAKEKIFLKKYKDNNYSMLLKSQNPKMAKADPFIQPLEEAFEQAMKEPATSQLKDPNFLRNLLFDCAREQDFAKVAQELRSKCSSDDVTVKDEAMDRVENGIFLGHEALTGVSPSEMGKLDRKCERAGKVGGFYVCIYQDINREKRKYFSGDFKDLAPSGCDTLALIDDKMRCFETVRKTGEPNTHKLKSAHSSNGKADNTNCGKIFQNPSAGPSSGKRSTIPKK